MAGFPSAGSVSTEPGNDTGISAVDSARYTRDLLVNLMRMALRQDQMVLARLLETAGREAARLAAERNG